MRTGWRVLASALVVVAVAAGAYAVGWIDDNAAVDRNFVIDRFDQQVVITADGETRVRELIDVTFATSRRGIFRDFDARVPFRSRGDFSEIEVDRPGADQPWNHVVESGPTGPRVRIGDAAVYLDPGSYRYGLRYSAPSWYYRLRGDEDRVEVRIDAPGFDWPTSIAASTLTVQVPGPILEVACVEGASRTAEPCATTPVIAGDRVTFTFRPFADRESGTVSVILAAEAFDTSLYTVRAAPLESRGWFAPLTLDRTTSALLLVLLLVAGFVGWEATASWILYRDRVTDPTLHDRRHPTAIPAPPFGFRPPEVAGLLLRNDADDLFLATLVDLDQRGAITTSTESIPGRLFTSDAEHLTVTPRRGGGALPPEDSAVIAALLPAGATTTFDGTYDSTVAERVQKASSELTERASQVFATHGFLHDQAGWLGRVWLRAGAEVLLVVVAAIIALGVSAITPLSTPAGLVIAAIGVAGWQVARLPWRHHRKPLNSAGRDAVAQARSFREFVRTVEGEQLEWAAGQPGIDHHHPAVSLLPYAVALGLADSWYERFGSTMRELAAVGAAGAGTVGATWWTSQNSFGNVRTSQAGTSTAPSSSGGSSGGGSGGGGGGGGSW